MTMRANSPAVVPKTFTELRDAVMAVVVEGRQAIDRAWVESYHEIGRLIHVHLLFKQERAAYGAGVFSEQKLRLRGLDCPELSTPNGKAAKRFVDALTAKATAITINTTKPDKYDRYLADVFLTTESGEVYLNHALLSNGHAVRKDAADFGDDWGFK